MLSFQFVAAKHAYLSNVENTLGDYLLEVELHRKSQSEVQALAKEIARCRLMLDYCSFCHGGVILNQ